MVGVVFGMPEVLTSSSSSSSTTTSVSGVPDADKAMKLLFKNEDLLKLMSDSSFTYLPPSKSMLAESLWALLNPRSDSSISLEDIETVVRDNGGNAAEATALWNIMNPDRKSSITATDYIQLDYLAVIIPDILETVRADVEEFRQQAALEKARSTSNSVLDMAMSSPLDSSYINMFV